LFDDSDKKTLKSFLKKEDMAFKKVLSDIWYFIQNDDRNKILEDMSQKTKENFNKVFEIIKFRK
jgi:hypothetical protein